MSAAHTSHNSGSRAVAVRALGRILSKNEQLEVSLASDTQFSALEPRDRAFAKSRPLM